MNASQKYFKELSNMAKRPRAELERIAQKARGDLGVLTVAKIGTAAHRAYSDAKHALEWHDFYSDKV